MNETEALEQFEDACYKYSRQWMSYPSISKAFDLEDLAQISRTYVIKAVREYDDSRGMTLSSYIITRIRWGLNSTLRSYMKTVKDVHVFEVSIQTLLHEEWGETFDYYYEQEFIDGFEDMISKLPSEDQHILRLRFKDGQGLWEIGGQVDKSGEWVRMHINKLLNTLRG